MGQCSGNPKLMSDSTGSDDATEFGEAPLPGSAPGSADCASPGAGERWVNPMPAPIPTSAIARATAAIRVGRFVWGRSVDVCVMSDSRCVSFAETSAVSNARRASICSGVSTCAAFHNPRPDGAVLSPGSFCGFLVDIRLSLQRVQYRRQCCCELVSLTMP